MRNLMYGVLEAPISEESIYWFALAFLGLQQGELGSHWWSQVVAIVEAVLSASDLCSI